MELRQLKTFRTVATMLSFTRAAAALDYVQSSVTAQIQALEEELGLPLFDRLGKRVSLTDAGARLLLYADRLLDLADEARLAVSGGDEPAGSLTISAPETLCTYRLPALLRKIRDRYPLIRIVFRPSAVPDLRRLVSEGTLDVAFVLDEPFPAAGLRVEPLLSEPVLVLAPPEHRLAGASSVGPADLEGEPLLLTELGCSYRRMFERALTAAGVYPATTLEFGSIEAIKQCVISGMGITVLPAISAATEIAQGRLAVLPWADRDFQVLTQMMWHKDRWLSPALSAFLAMARTMLTPAVDTGTGS